MAVTVADAERVYQAIDEHLKTAQTLPTQRQIAQTLGMKAADVARCVSLLRRAEWLEATTLLPTDYHVHWRQTAEREDVG